MKPIYVVLIFCFIISACASESDSVPEFDASETKEWIHLFNGENLDGWDIKIAGYELNDNVYNTFRVEEGMLRVSYEDYERWNGELGHIFYHKPFSHYHIVVEYRFTGDQVKDGPDWGFRNNGIMMHSQSAESMTLEQLLPISFEMQLLGGDGVNDRTNGNLYAPGVQVKIDGVLQEEDWIEANAGTYHGDDWVRAEAIVLGDSLIQHILEGEVVLEYTNPRMGGEGPDHYDPDVKIYGKPLTEGHIAFQAETHPTDFRTIKILPLKGCMDPDAENFKTYYIEPAPEACVY
ncbi:DUF1080 domain-containing protein [Balneolaceae bacterium ANBcel3]|nr:DUF1080 domain-containing protein [Balneolaceae bacterium ANBcel3]